MGCHFGSPSKFLIPLPNLVAFYLGYQLWAPPIFFHFHGAVPIRRTQGERPRPARRRRPRPAPADATPPAALAAAPPLPTPRRRPP